MSGESFITPSKGRKISKSMKHEEQIMLHLADFLLKDNLITPEEKFCLKQLIKKGGNPI